MGVFPSGQWGQTVNLLLSASVVRIHPRPPRTPVSNGYRSFCFICLEKGMQGWIRTAAALSQKTAQKQPSGLFLAARLATSTRAHQKSSTHERALSFLFYASCLKIRRILRKKKKARQSLTDRRAILVGAAGFEPTASSSRTKRATNCAMPRKYRSFSAAVWLGMRESNSHK